MSPRGASQSGIHKMNVMNFLKPKKDKERSDRGEEKSNDSRFLPIDHGQGDYQKVINRQGSKKLIQGKPGGFGGGNQFMQNKLVN
jgi:hypothetical protein